jgi:hypothetical protein
MASSAAILDPPQAEILTRGGVVYKLRHSILYQTNINEYYLLALAAATTA